MKFLLTILSIAMMAQASMAGSLGRFKRADEVEQAMTDLLKISRELVDYSVTVANAIVGAIPETEKYATYRHDLEEFVKVATGLKGESGNCVVKTGTALKALFAMFEKYNEEEEPSAEFKEVEELFEKFGGEKLEKETKEFQEKYYNAEFLKKIESYKKEKIENWAFLKENC